MPIVPKCLSFRPNWLPPSPLGTKGGGQHSLVGKKGWVGEANSDDWRESLALGLLYGCASYEKELIHTRNKREVAFIV
jgi:hypothetical protein